MHIVLVQELLHLVGQIMVAREAIGRDAGEFESAQQSFVTRLGSVVNQVAGGQHQIGYSLLVQRLGEYLIKGLQGVDA
jgi:hypothetical protein